jgi:hypothetical protein
MHFARLSRWQSRSLGHLPAAEPDVALFIANRGLRFAMAYYVCGLGGIFFIWNGLRRLSLY